MQAVNSGLGSVISVNYHNIYGLMTVYVCMSIS